MLLFHSCFVYQKVNQFCQFSNSNTMAWGKCLHIALPFRSVKDLNDVFTEPNYNVIDVRVEAENIFLHYLEESRNRTSIACCHLLKNSN